MSDEHVVTVEAVQTGRMVYRKDIQDFHPDGQDHIGLYECQCGRLFADRDRAIDHVDAEGEDDHFALSTLDYQVLRSLATMWGVDVPGSNPTKRDVVRELLKAGIDPDDVDEGIGSIRGSA